uniref:Uncharacterized protein ycf23 n=1 Tax=Picea sitchensis TaxID=3332 RepID=A9NTP5_PICSI|nr:unknown [Picea sitchensis]
MANSSLSLSSLSLGGPRAVATTAAWQDARSSSSFFHCKSPASASKFGGSSLMRSSSSRGINDAKMNGVKARQPLRVTAVSAASHREFVLKDFHARRALKIISGLQNFNSDSVASVVTAAEKGGATHVDIACDPELVKLAISLTRLPVCVSAVDPEAFLTAVEAGAHMVEIGNYDSFYSTGRTFSSEEVTLAESLEWEGVDIIQTEGGTSSDPSRPGVHGLIEKAVPTLAAAYSISRAIKIPVMCASGVSIITAPMAIAVGAAGVGVGSAVNKLNDQVAMIAEVRSIANALGLPSHASKTNLAAAGV